MYVCMYVCMFVMLLLNSLHLWRQRFFYDPMKEYYFLEIHPTIILSTNSQITVVVITYNC